MFIFLFAMWIVFNGRITAETVLLGLLFSAAVFAFLCRFLDHSLKKELGLLKLSGLLARYLCVLVAEIVKATCGACRYIVSPTLPHDPLICKFRTPLKTDIARVVLANSITLTPGTISVPVEGDRYCVHCLDKTFSEGIESSDFVRILHRLEADW